ncbi:RTA1 like domain protein [Paramyrothecium foliicola]|nr:RTA1 like domain protein [Paramyrothecium foliicola]
MASLFARSGPSAEQLFCLDNPDEALCANVPSFYEYRIDFAANVAFLALFGLSFVGFAAAWAFTRVAVAFNVAVMLGLVCEVLGYVGRIMSYENQWEDTGFLIQICCLTIGPAFVAAGLYLCLRRIVTAFGSENSRIPPEFYTRIFIPCDVVSLILQALGGAWASVATHNHDSSTTGTNIMIAGLAFQVATIVAFIIASLDFALRTYRRQRSLGDAALAQDPSIVRMRSTWRFKGFLGALALSTLCVLWRSAFRVAELSEGWTGPIIARQELFIAFEGVLIVVAVAVLNVFHPAFCMREVFQAGGGLKGCWCIRRKGGAPKSDAVEESI